MLGLYHQQRRCTLWHCCSRGEGAELSSPSGTQSPPPCLMDGKYFKNEMRGMKKRRHTEGVSMERERGSERQGHTCVSPEALAGVPSCASLRHLHLQVATSQEVSLPGVIHTFTTQDCDVTEGPALQTHPPEETTDLLCL